MQIFYPDLYPIHTIEDKVSPNRIHHFSREIIREHCMTRIQWETSSLRVSRVLHRELHLDDWCILLLESSRSGWRRWTAYPSTYSFIISTYWFTWCLHLGYQWIHLYLHWQSNQWSFRAECIQCFDILSFTIGLSKQNETDRCLCNTVYFLSFQYTLPEFENPLSMKIHNFLSYLIQSRAHGVAIHIMRYESISLLTVQCWSVVCFYLGRTHLIDICLLVISLMTNLNRPCHTWNSSVLFANRLLNEYSCVCAFVIYYSVFLFSSLIPSISLPLSRLVFSLFFFFIRAGRQAWKLRRQNWRTHSIVSFCMYSPDLNKRNSSICLKGYFFAHVRHDLPLIIGWCLWSTVLQNPSIFWENFHMVLRLFL